MKVHKALPLTYLNACHANEQWLLACYVRVEKKSARSLLAEMEIALLWKAVWRFLKVVKLLWGHSNLTAENICTGSWKSFKGATLDAFVYWLAMHHYSKPPRCEINLVVLKQMKWIRKYILGPMRCLSEESCLPSRLTTRVWYLGPAW